ALGQPGLQFLELALDAFDHLERVAALAHHHDAADHFPRRARRAAAVKIGDAAAHLGPLDHHGDVAEGDGQPRGRIVLARHRADVVDAAQVAARADHVFGLAHLDGLAPAVGVGAPQRGLDLHHADTEAPQARGIDLYLVLLDVS